MNISLPKNRLLLIVLAVSCLIYLPIFFQNIYYLDRTFLPDDTYYTLNITRNIAHGCGASIDCVNKTSGFQPLISLFQLPVFWITDDLYAPVRYSIFLSMLFGVLTNIAVARLSYRLSGKFFLSLLFSCFCIALTNNILNFFNGLETSLTCLLGVLALSKLYELTDQSNLKDFAVLGVLIGLSLLARIDMAIPALFCGLFLLANYPFKKVLPVPVAALVVVSPVWLYNFIYMHSIIPESGKAVKTIVAFHQSLDLTTTKVLEYASGKINLLSYPNGLLDIIFLLLMAVVILYTVYTACIQKRFTFELVLALSIISLFLFYVLYLPAYWFFHRYLTFTVILYALLLFRYLAEIKVPKAAYIMLCFLLIPNLLNLRLFFEKPDHSLQILNDGEKGYMSVSETVLNALPQNSRIGAMQSGALTYFAVKKHQYVLNLDGVVNKDAHAAILTRSMDKYLLQNKIGYFADWDFNLSWLSQISDASKIEITPLFSAEKQGKNSTTVYHIQISGESAQ